MELKNYIEHTLLKQDAQKNELDKLFKEAIEHQFLGVCVNPVNVPMAVSALEGSGVKVVTVVGFPLGASKTEIKIFETLTAIKDGADEIDMVINVSDLKNKDYDKILYEITALKTACGDKLLKVIVETDLLTADEIAKISELVVQGGADIIKTSTGFVKNGVGAKVEDVKLMHSIVSPYGLGVKASGGIKTKEQALALIEAGATRLGTSSGVQIVEG